MKPTKPKAGSPTNASDAVDDVELPPTASPEEKVDAGVKETFPASDPVSVVQPRNTADDRRKRGEADPVPPQPQKRSPDWLLEKRR